MSVRAGLLVAAVLVSLGVTATLLRLGWAVAIAAYAAGTATLTVMLLLWRRP